MEMWENAKCQIVDAACRKDWELVAKLVDAGHSVHTRSKFNGRNALHYASGYGDLTTVQLLVRRNIDVNESDLAGMTPLHWAARKDHTTVARFLVESGADVMARVKKGVLSGKLPLDLARDGRQAECADYLLGCITSTSWWPHKEVLEFLQAERGVVTSRYSIAPSDANEMNLNQVFPNNFS